MTSGTRRVVVVGDLLLDRDVTGEVHRVCPDAPVPVLDVAAEQESPGGAGLAAVQATAPDIEVTLVAPVADDAAGDRLRELLRAGGVELAALRHDGATRTKTRVRAGGQSLVRLDSGGGGRPTGSVPTAAREALEAADAVLVSDYGAGMTAHPQVRTLLGELIVGRGRHAARICWDPHPRGSAPVPGCTLVTPNLSEARGVLAGRDQTRDHDALGAAAAAERLRMHWAAGAVAVTVGAAGAWLATSSTAPLFVPATAVSDSDPCGAGDCFAASVARSLARGALPSEAVQRAVLDASAWVAAGGAAGYRARGEAGYWARGEAGYRARGEAGLAPVAGQPAAGRAGADRLVTQLRGRGGTLVATGGCFDVLHAGHIASLQAARALGDALVVLLNSDESVSRLKGADRPVHRMADRIAVLEALSCVDAVVVFDEDDPRAALARLRPDVWAKGGDYAEESLPEADLVRRWGGQVVLLPYLAGRSTTAILQTIR